MQEILAYFKETENKWRWDAILNDEKGEKAIFELYIPKWRVPEPYPEKIRVKIGEPHEFPNKKYFNREDIEQNAELKNNRIYAEVKRFSEHKKTIRFNPIGDEKNWEIGSPYIPFQLLPDEDIEHICLSVEWY